MSAEMGGVIQVVVNLQALVYTCFEVTRASVRSVRVFGYLVYDNSHNE